ncbi:transmembrane transporter [Malassezia pachydermatis]
MCGCVFLQMSDKMLLNSVSLLTFLEDNHLDRYHFSWISSIFYFGYLAGCFIHGYFVQRVNLNRYVTVIIMVWEVVLTCDRACHTYGSFLAVRFFLGLFEAAITPSFILLTGRFYTRKEQVIRMNIWFSMNGIAQILAGAATYAVSVNSLSLISRWQELFLVYGIIAILFGFIGFFFMPNSPETTTYLSEKERGVAIWRIASNQSGIHDSTWKWEQFREAITDLRLYLFFLGYVCLIIVNGGITTYGNVIIKSFHYDNKQSSLLSMTIGGGEIVSVYLGAFMFHVINRRDLPMVLGLLVALAGAILMVAIPEEAKAGRMTGYALVSFFSIPLPMYYTWQSTAVSGTT